MTAAAAAVRPPGTGTALSSEWAWGEPRMSATLDQGDNHRGCPGRRSRARRPSSTDASSRPRTETAPRSTGARTSKAQRRTARCTAARGATPRGVTPAPSARCRGSSRMPGRAPRSCTGECAGRATSTRRSQPRSSAAGRFLPSTGARSGSRDADVASGQYDSWLTSQATAMKNFGHPMFLLFDEEMNGTWYPYSPGQEGNTPADFVAMWRHVHDIFAVGRSHQRHLGLVSEHRSIASPTGQAPRHRSTSSIRAMRTSTGPASTATTGAAATGRASRRSSGLAMTALLKLAPTKPIMIGEVASAEEGGSKAAWITDALGTELPQNFPQVKALLWFNWNVLEKGTRWPWEIESSTASQQAFATGIKLALLRTERKLRQPHLPEQGPAAPVTAAAGSAGRADRVGRPPRRRRVLPASARLG